MLENAEDYNFNLKAKDINGRNGFELARYYRKHYVTSLIAMKMPSMTSYLDILHTFIDYMKTWTDKTKDLVFLVREIFQIDRQENFEIAVNLFNQVVQLGYDHKSIETLLCNELEKSREPTR